MTSKRIDDLQVTTGDIIPEWTEEDKARLKEVLKTIFDIEENNDEQQN